MAFSGPATKLKKNGFIEWAREYDMDPSDTSVIDGLEPAFGLTSLRERFRPPRNQYHLSLSLVVSFVEGSRSV